MSSKKSVPSSIALLNVLAARGRAHDKTMRLVFRLLVSLVLAAMALSRPTHDNTYKPEADIGS